MSDEPTRVVDWLGNTWHRYNDIGYARLVIVPGSGVGDRAALEKQVGPVAALHHATVHGFRVMLAHIPAVPAVYDLTGCEGR